MSLFGASSSLNQDIEKATSENSTTENWGLILDICDRVNNGSATPKDCLKSIVKRLNSPNPHVVMKAITLLDACVNNCGKQFHLEVASREFETEFKKLLQKSQPKVNTKLKLTLKQWSEKVFKSDPQLDLIPSLYKKLREEGHDFSDPSATPKRETTLSKDPNVVSSQQEEDDIAKAIELSLKEVKINQSPKMLPSSGATSSSLYPSALLSGAPVPEPRKVRALYDFEAAEDNELTFQAGEIIMVLDDSDPNWWKGQNQRGEGLFPSNFVTADLSVEPETLNTASSQGAKKTVQFSDEQQKSESDKELLNASTTVEINEEKIDRLLHLIHEADPEDPSQDTEEMLQLEQLVNQMGPMIDAELERVDRKHAQLTQLSSDLVDAINLYHNLMREPDRSSTMRAMAMGGGLQGSYGLPPPPGGHPVGPASMGPMYGMPGMFQTMPDGGMYPMGPGQQPVSMDGSSTMQRYSTGHNYYDPAAMNASPMADHSQSHQTMHHPHPHHHHQQQQQQQQQPPPPAPSQQVPLPVVSQNGPITNGMVPPQANIAPVMSMGPGITSQQVPPQTSNTTNPQGMPPNMTVPPMAYNNPTSPPPTGLSGPQAQAFRQMRPMGQPGQPGQPGQQLPPVSFSNYVPQQPSHQQSQPAAPQLGQPPQGVQQHQQGPPQHHVPVSVGTAAQTTAPSTANMNHHQHHHHPQQQQQQQQFPMNMPPSHFSAPSITAAPAHHLQQQQPPTVFLPQMGPTSNPMGNFSMGPMSMFPPGAGTTGTAGPLSINTNHSGPQNIPIYQQQR